MAEFRNPAIKIHQGKRVLFITFFSVKDFLRDDFYRVDRLDVEESTGMQRLLNQSRVNSYSKDILNADEHNEMFLPTSVFLATEGSIGYDENKQELFFDLSSDGGVCPFDVVDGQHRIEGFKQAAQKKGDERLMDFKIPTVIAPKLSEAERMLQFVVVNTKQTPVVKGVAQHIIARFTKMLGVEETPHLPTWLERAITKGDDDKALAIVTKLNSNSDSPWYERVTLADAMKDSKKHTIAQGSFVTSVKKHLLTRNHPLQSIPSDDEKRLAILTNFWKAVENIFVDKQSDAQSVVFKTNGLEFFHGISAPVLNRLARNSSYTVDDFERCIRSAEEYISSPEIMHPDYWQSGNEASGLNNTSAGKLATEFFVALSETNNDDDIKV